MKTKFTIITVFMLAFTHAQQTNNLDGVKTTQNPIYSNTPSQVNSYTGTEAVVNDSQITYQTSIINGNSSPSTNANNLYRKNEVKINFAMLFLGPIELSYERFLTEKSALGSNFLISNKTFFGNHINFAASPYYRSYFGKGLCQGLFIDGFTTINHGKNVNKNVVFTDLALGLGGGYKWKHSQGLLIELSAGIGKNLFKSDSNPSPSFIINGGLRVGYTF